MKFREFNSTNIHSRLMTTVSANLSRWTFLFAFVAGAWACVETARTVLAAEPPSDASAHISEPPIEDEDRDHWAFSPLVRPAVPQVKNEDWPRNTIDRFILSRMERAGLSPMPECDRTTLIRRVTFDLTGLPPTPADIDKFVGDESPRAYANLVDQLLASDAYGERWAQHWLDLARFAETDGFEHDHVREHSWQYRDWVIDALNRDLPYDEFVRVQIAGDELYQFTPEEIQAVRFLLCGPDMPDINLVSERRHSFLNDITSTVSSMFLGLQMGCAQCHDHKYDPISQLDFYRLRAFFESSVDFQKNKSAQIALASSRGISAHLMIRGDFRRPGPQVMPAFPRIANPWDEEVPAELQSPGADGARTALADWLTRPDHPLTTRVIVNRVWQHHFGRGLSSTPSDFGVMGQWPSHPMLLDWLATELPRLGWSLKAMHRLMVTSATYRTVSRPSPSIADVWQESLKVDPENEYWSRANRRRLEGEAIRDAMLASADRLSRRRGGRGVRPPLPDELVSTLLKNQWNVDPDEEDHRRRSIYLFVRRNLRFPLFEAFDKPDTNASCPERNESTIAPQALMLLNSELTLNAARDLASAVLKQAPRDRKEQIRICYRRALGRFPTDAESEIAEEFLLGNIDRLRESGRSVESLALPDHLDESIDPYSAAALTDLCLSIYNLNEFIYID